MDTSRRASLIASLLCAHVLSSCATPLLPLPPGTAEVHDAGHGLVFGQIRIIRAGFDQMAYSFGKEFGWWLTQIDTGTRYVVRTLTHEGPFVLNLPSGYRITGLIYDEGAGVWEGKVSADFHVAAGEATYLGTWSITFEFPGRAGNVTAGVVNELDRARPLLLKTYVGRPKPLKVSLLHTAQQGYFSLVELRIGQ
jgi:hypothetical protein